MSVRRAAQADLPAILAIERSAQSAAHWSAAHYTTALGRTDYLALVAEDRGAVSGFLVARAEGPEWELENVVVACDSQRRGIARSLIAELLRAARAQETVAVFLEVRESNAAAQKLYESAGFTLVGRRSAYYSDPPEDALLYRFLGIQEHAKSVERA